MAAIFPIRLCKAILSGLRDQLKRDWTVIEGHASMHEISVARDGLISLCAAQERDDLVEHNGHVLKFDDGGPLLRRPHQAITVSFIGQGSEEERAGVLRD